MTPEMQAMLDMLEAEAVSTARSMVADERTAMIQAAVETRVAKLRDTLRRELDVAIIARDEAQVRLAIANETIDAERSKMGMALHEKDEEIGVERAMRTHLQEALSRVEAAVNREVPPIEFPPSPPPTDLTPVLASVEAQGTRLLTAIAGMAPRAPREIAELVPIRGGPENLIVDVKVKYKDAH